MTQYWPNGPDSSKWVQNGSNLRSVGSYSRPVWIRTDPGSEIQVMDVHPAIPCTIICVATPVWAYQCTTMELRVANTCEYLLQNLQNRVQNGSKMGRFWGPGPGFGVKMGPNWDPFEALY